MLKYFYIYGFEFNNIGVIIGDKKELKKYVRDYGEEFIDDGKREIINNDLEVIVGGFDEVMGKGEVGEILKYLDYKFGKWIFNLFILYYNIDVWLIL